MNIHHHLRRGVSLLVAGSAVAAALGLVPAVAGQTNCGSNYTVQSSDTLAGIAARCGIPLDALEQANPQLASPSLIYPGQQLNIPAATAAPTAATATPTAATATPTAAAPSQAAGLDVLPFIGAPGTYVEIVGSNFAPNSGVTLAVGQGSVAPVLSISAATDGSGSFVTQVMMPTTAPSENAWNIQASSSIAGGPSASGTFQVVAAEPAGAYTVSWADTLDSLAASFGTTPGAIEAANPGISDPSLVAPGEQLLMPGTTVMEGLQPVYIANAGDDLSLIARNEDTTVSDLMAANPRINGAAQIAAGSQLLLPGSLIPITGLKATLTLAPSAGNPNTLVTITGAGFPANTSVTLTVGPSGQTASNTLNLTVDATGSFTSQLAIPVDTLPGTQWAFTATSADGSQTAAAEFQVNSVAR